MGGPRANHIFVVEQELFCYTTKYGGANIPDKLIAGPQYFLDWLNQVIDRYTQPNGLYTESPFITPDGLYDSGYCEGAFVINFDHKELIAGFDRWDDWAYQPQRGFGFFGALAEEYPSLLDSRILRTIFRDMLADFWPQWSINFADHRDFAVAGHVKLRSHDIPCLCFSEPNEIRDFPYREEAIQNIVKGLSLNSSNKKSLRSWLEKRQNSES